MSSSAQGGPRLHLSHRQYTTRLSQKLQRWLRAALCTQVWPRHKRWTVSVLVKNVPAVAFWRAVGYTDYDLTLEIMPQA